MLNLLYLHITFHGLWADESENVLYTLGHKEAKRVTCAGSQIFAPGLINTTANRPRLIKAGMNSSNPLITVWVALLCNPVCHTSFYQHPPNAGFTDPGNLCALQLIQRNSVDSIDWKEKHSLVPKIKFWKQLTSARDDKIFCFVKPLILLVPLVSELQIIHYSNINNSIVLILSCKRYG